MASRADRIPSGSQRPRLTAGKVERIVSGFFVALIAAAVLFGWLHRRDDWIDPHSGIGYSLGIIGGSLMLLLLAYPIRKRTRSAPRAAGSVGFWFRLHMMLGLIGPLAILYHSRFTWGALNSAFALGAMIIVASSGLIGRFFYSRVHRGYSDRKLEVRALKTEMDEKLAALLAGGGGESELITLIQPFEDRAVRAGGNFWSSAAAVIGLSIETRRLHRQLLRRVPQGADRRTIQLRELLGEYFQAVRRAAEFAFYDRLLRLWHLLHLPLFILLVAAALLHVVAVNMY